MSCWEKLYSAYSTQQLSVQTNILKISQLFCVHILACVKEETLQCVKYAKEYFCANRSNVF